MPTTYNPNREAQFAQLLAQGQAGFNNDWGQTIGNLARVLSGTIGMKRQGKARQAAEQQMMEQQQAAEQEKASRLAQILSGFGGGAEIDTKFAPLILDNPALTKEFLDRTRPQAPEPEAEKKPVMLQRFEGPQGGMHTFNPETGETKQIMAAPEPKPDPKAQQQEAQQQAQVAFLTQRGIEPERAEAAVLAGPTFIKAMLDDMRRPPEQQVKPITPINLYNPADRQQKTVTSQAELESLAAQGWIKGVPPSDDARKIGQEALKTGASISAVENAAEKFIDLLDKGYEPNIAGTGNEHKDLSRAFNELVLHAATATGRGANFTDMERALLTNAIGVDPESYTNWLRAGDVESIKGRVREFVEGVRAYGENLLGERGTVAEPVQPAAINPQTLSPNNPYRQELMRRMGGQ